MSPRPHFSVVGSGLLAITLLLSLLWVPFPFRSFLWRAIYNFAHVALFALLAILLVIVSRHLFLHWPSQNQDSDTRYRIVFSVFGRPMKKQVP